MSFETEARNEAAVLLNRAISDLMVARDMLAGLHRGGRKQREEVSRMLAGVIGTCETIRLSLRKPGE